MICSFTNNVTSLIPFFDAHLMEAKPLPAIPQSPSTLSIQARKHRARFIRFVHSELATTNWFQSNSNSLVEVIQDALDSLPTEDWLADRRKHHQLLLCLAPLGSRWLIPEEDEGFDIIPDTIRLRFQSGVFVWDDARPDGTILYGSPTTDNATTIGGTFQLRGVPSTNDHTLLYTSLKLAIYAHLSLVLEQHLLTDSGVRLTYVPINQHARLRHGLSHKSTKSVGALTLDSEGTTGRDEREPEKETNRKNLKLPINFSKNSLFSFLAKRNLGPSTSLSSPDDVGSSRGGSLDIARTTSPESGADVGITFPQTDNQGHNHANAPSHDDPTSMGGRIRRFSFLPSSSNFSGLSFGHSHGKEGSTSTSHTANTAATAVSTAPNKLMHFNSLLTKIQLQTSEGAFSTSIGVSYPFPILIVKLAEREQERERGRELERKRSLLSKGSKVSAGKKPQPQPLQQHHHHSHLLAGDERTALTSLLGWSSSSANSTSGQGSEPGSESGSGFSSTSGSSTASAATGSIPTKGLGMIGIPGFIRHQEISVLESSHVPLSNPVTDKSNVHVPTAEKRKNKGTETESTLPKVPAEADLGGQSVGGKHEQGASLTSQASDTPAASTSTEASLVSGMSNVGSTSDTASISSLSSASSTTTVKDKDMDKIKKDKEKEKNQKSNYSTCDQPHWRTYRYFDFSSEKSASEQKEKSKGIGRDRHLGQLLEEWVDEAEKACWELALEREREREKELEKEREREKESSSYGHERGEASGSVSGNEEGGEKGKEVSKEKDKLKEREKEKGRTRCEAKVGRHERRYVHGGVRVSVTVRAIKGGKDGDDGVNRAEQENKETSRVIQVWESCSMCGAETQKNEMSYGTYLFSFAKYLELLIYSPVLATISPPLCEHTTSAAVPVSPTSSTATTPSAQSHVSFPTLLAPDPDESVVATKFSTSTSTPKLADERFNIIRHFSTTSLDSGKKDTTKDKKYVISFSLSPVDDVFELRVPRLKVCKDKDREHIGPMISATPSIASSRNSVVSEISALSGFSSVSEASGNSDGGGEDEKRKLRKEIKSWWEGVADHLDALEESTLGDDTEELRALKKALPRLPSADDDYLDFDDDEPSSEPESDSKSITTETTPLAETPSTPTTPKADSVIGKKHKSGASIGGYFNFHPPRVLRSGPQAPPPTPESPLATPPAHAYKRPALLGAFKSMTSIAEITKSQPNANANINLPSTPNVQSSSTPDLNSKPRSDGHGDVHTPSSASFASSGASSSTSTPSSSSVSDATPTPSREQSTSSKVQSPDKPISELLMNLRQTFQKTEQSLYIQLSKTPVSSLNDVRRAFLSSAKGAQRRLAAWQEKHFGKKSKPDNLKVPEPDWWGKACHVLPQGNIVIREDDWGSIIAFTLNTVEYHRELAHMTPNRIEGSLPLSPVEAPSQPQTPSTPEPGTPASSQSSFLSAATATGYKLFRLSANTSPDPDQEDVIWHEPEAYSAVISRKDHPRDPTSLLSLREVLRQKSPAIPDVQLLSASRFGSLGSLKSSKLFGSAESKDTGVNTPPSAWAKPEVQVIKQAAPGEVSGLPGNPTDRLLHELEPLVDRSGELTPTSSRHSSAAGTYGWSGSEGEGSEIRFRRGDKGASLFSVESGSSDTKSDSTIGPETSVSNVSAVLPPKDGPTPAVPPKDIVSSFIESPAPTRSHLSTFASGLTNAMRLVYNPGELISRPTSAAGSNRHGLLSAELSANLLESDAVIERPHIKYDWTIGKRLKFSCTAYYAKQFDTLRRRCGIEDVFLKSLSKSTNWSADGGKSKSNFWKTKDDRFIIKTLVNAWNVADLQVLIELGPSYFRYLESTANKATTLAKLMGFYTIEIRNLETGAVQSKADLLVMENLFYDQKIDKTFDLKGIQGRRVKGATTKGQVSKTLFDGEWIEGLQQSLTLIRPHSKVVLREAIKSDADFLSRSNIMDYSLLLGVDTEHRQIACGLVDTIGSYTFAKTLEYKAKQGLQSAGGKEVTVVPPAEYQERFMNALERYFLACPGMRFPCLMILLF
ncbi:hypothetical protein K435DRAFT_445881 [Dendrothele bispora CBS 962.96]|uniref:PIPK domain-containing protein n=1 Tax=Dendrothele bispora (strain CBS 962.96) TaxID=1314807 RepID=A0A4V6T517_DENBC|nr:hypothetical protein K435DRAFT_445881 [Dendrothele bispora CBS 962.96]